MKLEETYEDQPERVKIIVQTVLRALDQELFPVSEEIIRNLIHNRHKHQREEYLRKQKPETFQTNQAKRKHSNSRRNDVSDFFII